MSWMFEQPLPINEVHKLLLKPRNLSRIEFGKLCFFTNAMPNYILECQKTFTAAIEVGICESNGDARRMMKQGSFFVGKRQIKDFNDLLEVNEFFETGYEGMRWTSIRNGKKRSEPIIIWEDEEMFPKDPWFGLDYERWLENRTK